MTTPNILQRLNVRRDLENIGSIPCARTSLLYGIGGGAGIGAVRYLSLRSELPTVIRPNGQSRLSLLIGR